MIQVEPGLPVLCWCGRSGQHGWDPVGNWRYMPCPTVPKLRPLPEPRPRRRAPAR